MILFTSFIVAGIQQSVVSLDVAAFAKASACSFPGIPTWADQSDIFAFFLKLWNSRKNSVNIVVVIGIVAFF